ncbi:ATP-binding cassette domain-containing protein [Mahella sp.]|uniref:ABC transporter ATP-binding protein n=1 Tax=Mahella sp. TaxID=2798721 RepID=UPI0025C49C5A|nr:ATP-binding cassette domain-containing protein [Mahella sp.]MBZ4666595.1 rane protein [Mahella sp.]
MEIRVNNITVTISGKKIFSDISFVIKTGEMVAITGKSGCGKTTLLNTLGLIQSTDTGEIFIDTKNATKWSDKQKTKFWHENAAFIYQDYGIIEDENVAYNITLNKVTAKNKEVKEILQKVGLDGREKDLAIVLSGGEKQRIGIARAIFKKASIIYADEPTASLDANNRELVMALLHQCAKQGAIVILATHDERLVQVCDKVINMECF